VPALLEEALCRRQALLRVDVVDDHDAIAGFDASWEHIARLVVVSFTYMRSEVDLTPYIPTQRAAIVGVSHLLHT